jgi:conflict system pore-forming effector with SLATT domain
MIRLSAIMAEPISSGQNQVSVPQDLQPAQAAEFSWAEGQRLSSLKKLRDIVANKIDITAGWYMRGKKGRRIFGRFARVGTMVLATLAAAQPTIAEMYRSQDHFWVQPGITTIFALAAAALLLLDRFFGASTGWVRYMTAGDSYLSVNRSFKALARRSFASSRRL